MTAAQIDPMLTGTDVNGDDGEANVNRWARAIDEWTDWMRAAGLRPDTIAIRRYTILRLAEESTSRSPWRIKTDDLARWLGSREWAPETRRVYRAGVRTFYRWAKTAGHVRRDPAADLPTIRVPRNVPRPTPDDVMDRAVAAADDRARLAICLAGYAGLRRAEIAGLRWDHISTDAVRVVGKGGRVRVIPLHPALQAELTAERARRDVGSRGTGWRYRTGIDEWVMPARTGGPMSPHSLGKMLSDVLGPGWTAHTLRHRFGTRAYRASHDLGVVQDLLGHASPETTRIYADPTDDALRAAVNAV